MIRFSLEQTLLIHKYLIEASGGAEGLRDKAALESAISAPFQTFCSEDLYPGKKRKAAASRGKLQIKHTDAPNSSARFLMKALSS